MLEKYRENFKGYFKTDITNFENPMLKLIGIYDFDIVLFNDYIVKTFGYNENGKSLSDFILEKFGKNAKNMIDNLIKLK
jgi:ABC-type transport system involved in Fe-S cluster assembly fused permease/ATPase subunit